MINVRVFQRHLRNHEQDDFEEIETDFMPVSQSIVEFRGKIYNAIRVTRDDYSNDYYDLLPQKIRVLE